MPDSPSIHRRSCSARRALIGRRAFLLSLFCLQISATTANAGGPFGDLDRTLNPTKIGVEDRLAILNLLSVYSPLADGLHTDLFGEFFAQDAVFEIVPYGAEVDASGRQTRQRVGKGRNEIVAALRPRHAEFRRSGVQRRHFLTNPVVWDQTDTTARVAVYLQLRSSRQGAASELVATGRYEGRVVKTLAGWRMAEWTIYSDQEIK